MLLFLYLPLIASLKAHHGKDAVSASKSELTKTSQDLGEQVSTKTPPKKPINVKVHCKFTVHSTGKSNYYSERTEEETIIVDRTPTMVLKGLDEFDSKLSLQLGANKTFIIAEFIESGTRNVTTQELENHHLQDSFAFDLHPVKVNTTGSIVCSPTHSQVVVITSSWLPFPWFPFF